MRKVTLCTPRRYILTILSYVVFCCCCFVFVVVVVVLKATLDIKLNFSPFCSCVVVFNLEFLGTKVSE